ncbi:MAG: Vi polysaccharide biosynthesis UDP-N-acetylglucosamine C-6 dehydrogenase TviB [Nitrospiria bacterium]
MTEQTLLETKIAIIGLGYVGLPLAAAFGETFETVAFDIDKTRIEALREGIDATLEVSEDALKHATKLRYTTLIEDARTCHFFIVTVPTPIDAYKRPDLSALIKASRSVGSVLKKNDIVVYESTVYPGVTEDVCVPVLEAASGLRFNHDFFVGYSPERINPGDKAHRVTHILKVVSGSTPETLERIDRLYSAVITAGTYRAESIRVAEAAKVIENTQRDVNIALVNELALLFNRLGLDTDAVLKAAGTKWNFLPFRPGLVGGHCIGVDPYYLTHKAQEVGYHPEVILAGRRINDNMGAYVAGEVIKLMTRRQIQVGGSRILVLGVTFKENCPDIRNTRVIDIVESLSGYGVNVELFDPWADANEVAREYGIALLREPKEGHYDAIILAVAHDAFKAWTQDRMTRFAKPDFVLYDVKHILDRAWVDGRL